MKKFLSLVFVILLGLASYGQQERQKIAVFTPLYLDSAFDARGAFRFEKTGAKFAAGGLDFYYGVQLALDSLKKRGAQLEVMVYDTRGKETIAQHLWWPQMREQILFYV